jgi:DNA polymerase I-like protein with 3'-5' exonuclease and polymerase domains
LNWDDNKFVALDFETSGSDERYALQPWRIRTGEFWATSISLIRWQVIDDMPKLAPDGSKLFFRPRYTDRMDRLEQWEVAAHIRSLLQRAIDEDWTVITWFGIFDISVCIAYGCGDLVHKVRWVDGMLLWRHFFIEPEYEADRSKKKSYSLKAFVPEFMPVEHHGYEQEINFHSEDPIALGHLQRYNDRDSVYTWIGGKIFWHELSPRQLNCALIESASMSLVAQANFTGMPVDVLAARELSATLKKTAADLLVELAPHGVTEKIVRSPTQLGKLLFDVWKLPVLKENTGKKTGKVSRATDKEVLHELAFQDPRAKQLREYREALNNDTKFAETPLISADYNGDGRTRPAGIIFGTYSGRMTYASAQGTGVKACQTGFALHQEKRGKDFRGIVVAPPGYTLMEFDASGQEFRWMAVISKDPTMLQLCLPGEDPHSFMGSRIASMDYQEMIRLIAEEDEEAKNGRQLGKVGNLSCQYRTSAKTLRRVARVQFLIPLELPAAQLIHSTYRRTYTEVPRYWDRTIRETKARGYVETLAGRRVQVTGNWDGNMGWSMESTSINYPVQGTGADQKYLAMQCLKPVILDMGAYFAWDLHDGIYLWVPDDKVEKMAVEGKRLLANLPYKRAWDFTPPIPMPWDCKYGPGWGALKEWKE